MSKLVRETRSKRLPDARGWTQARQRLLHFPSASRKRGRVVPCGTITIAYRHWWRWAVEIPWVLDVDSMTGYAESQKDAWASAQEAVRRMLSGCVLRRR